MRVARFFGVLIREVLAFIRDVWTEDIEFVLVDGVYWRGHEDKSQLLSTVSAIIPELVLCTVRKLRLPPEWQLPHNKGARPTKAGLGPARAESGVAGVPSPVPLVPMPMPRPEMKSVHPGEDGPGRDPEAGMAERNYKGSGCPNFCSDTLGVWKAFLFDGVITSPLETIPSLIHLQREWDQT